MIFVKKKAHSVNVVVMTSTFKRNLISMCIEVLTIGGMCCLNTLVINFDQITLRNNPKGNTLIVTTVRRRNLTKLYFIHGEYVLNYGIILSRLLVYIALLCSNVSVSPIFSV